VAIDLGIYTYLLYTDIDMPVLVLIDVGIVATGNNAPVYIRQTLIERSVEDEQRDSWTCGWNFYNRRDARGSCRTNGGSESVLAGEECTIGVEAAGEICGFG
jgi:hypothetical protein